MGGIDVTVYNNMAHVKPRHQQGDYVYIFLEHGADPNVTDVSGNTALQYVSSENIMAAKPIENRTTIDRKNKNVSSYFNFL